MCVELHSRTPEAPAGRVDEDMQTSARAAYFSVDAVWRGLCHDFSCLVGDYVPVVEAVV